MERRRGEAALDRRRCLSCGHGGRSLQGERGRLVYRCPCCEADLYARPAMSYAEMEGLEPSAGRSVWGSIVAAWLRMTGRARPTPVPAARPESAPVSENGPMPRSPDVVG